MIDRAKATTLHLLALERVERALLEEADSDELLTLSEALANITAATTALVDMGQRDPFGLYPPDLFIGETVDVPAGGLSCPVCGGSDFGTLESYEGPIRDTARRPHCGRVAVFGAAPIHCNECDYTGALRDIAIKLYCEMNQVPLPRGRLALALAEREKEGSGE